MGAHHFKFDLIPAGSHPTRNAEGDFKGGFLLQHPIPEEILARARTLLPKTNHWPPVEEFTTGGGWGSDIRIFHEDDGTVSDIGMRYAPVADPIEILKAFVEFARQAGCDLLVYPTGEVISPSFERVESALRGHKAFRFVKDPINTIKEAATETDPLD